MFEQIRARLAQMFPTITEDSSETEVIQALDDTPVVETNSENPSEVLDLLMSVTEGLEGLQNSVVTLNTKYTELTNQLNDYVKKNDSRIAKIVVSNTTKPAKPVDAVVTAITKAEEENVEDVQEIETSIYSTIKHSN